jgi:hypothetical protein
VAPGAQLTSNGLLCVPGAYQFNCTFTAWHPETGGANGSGPERASGPAAFPWYARTRAVTDVTSQALRRWRESRGWDVPRMARQLHKAARDTGEDVAAHHGPVKIIPQWERGDRVPRERYRLLHLKVFEDVAGGLSPGLAVGAEFAVRLAAVRARAARLPGPGQIRALEAAALTKPRRTMTPAEIRALAAETIASLHEVAGKLYARYAVLRYSLIRHSTTCLRSIRAVISAAWPGRPVVVFAAALGAAGDRSR